SGLSSVIGDFQKSMVPKGFDFAKYSGLSSVIGDFQKSTLLGSNSTFGMNVPNLSIFQPSATASKIAELYAPLAARAEALRKAYLPSANLYGVEGLSMTQTAELARNEGICLLHVPRAEIVKELIDAEDLLARRQVLRDRAVDIFDDCTAQLDVCVSLELSGFVPAMRESIDAARAGFMMPAQALATSVFDSVLNLVYDKETYTMVKSFSRRKEPTASLDDLDLRSRLVFSALWQVYMRFMPHKGDPIPESLARHGSAHAVDPLQYTPTNTVHAIMLGTSLLRYTNDLQVNEELETA
ncbi:hypothetical protein ACFT1B_34630, partial [Streptomyces griseoincarnatus]